MALTSDKGQRGKNLEGAGSLESVPFFNEQIALINQDAEILRLKELMRTTANSINERLAQLFKENDIIAEVPFFEAQD